MQKAITAQAKIFGINNRYLNTFNVDVGTTLDLVRYVPRGAPLVTESGISTYEDVRRLSGPRISAMLVGETFMKADEFAKQLNR